MTGKKAILARLLFHSGVLRRFRRSGSRNFVVFNYHRIRPDGRDFAPSFDEDVFGPTVSEFERQMSWLRSNARVVGEEQILEIAAGRDNGHPAAAVTFDDGYRDNFELALPVLRRHGIPAFFFIPSNLFDQRKLGWWDTIAYLVKRAPGERLDLDGRSYDLADRPATIHALHQRMKLEPHERTRELVQRLSQACAVLPPTLEEQGRELMTWDQLREARDQGITIGSHTHNHHVLATLDPARQEEELGRSKSFLEQQLGGEVRSLAYPVGGYAHFTPETRRLAQRCGYRLAFSFNTGINRTDALESYDVKRVGAPLDTAMFAATARFPTVFSWSSGYQ